MLERLNYRFGQGPTSAIGATDSKRSDGVGRPLDAVVGRLPHIEVEDEDMNPDNATFVFARCHAELPFPGVSG